MAIAFVDVGTWQQNGLDHDGAIPAGAASTNMMLLFVTWKDYQNTLAVSGWAELVDPEFADGTIGEGNGTGSVKVACFWKEHDGSEANPAIDFTSGFTNVAGDVIIVFSKGAGETWDTPVYTTAAISAATDITATGSSDPGGAGGDVWVQLIGIRNNTATFTRGADSLDQDGITWAADTVESPAAHFQTSAGPDLGGDLCYRIASSGTSTAAPTMTATLPTSETGACLWVRLRVTAAAGGDVFFENRHPIEFGMKPLTAAGMGGVLIE